MFASSSLQCNQSPEAETEVVMMTLSPAAAERFYCLMLVKCSHQKQIYQLKKKTKHDVGVFSAHLSGGLDSFPNTEVTDEPDDGQTQSQLPADWTQLV